MLLIRILASHECGSARLGNKVAPDNPITRERSTIGPEKFVPLTGVAVQRYETAHVLFTRALVPNRKRDG
jgi:hypothetical protein